MESFKEQAKRLSEHDDEILDFIPKVGYRYLEGWNDSKLADLRVGIAFPKSAYTRTNLKRILTRFYDCYFTGTIRPGDFLTSTVFDVIALAETEDGSIWNANDAQEIGWYPINTSDSSDLSVGGVGRIPRAKALRERRGSDRFQDFVKNEIAGIDLTNEASGKEKAFLRLTSFLALTLCRAATKKKAQLRNSFLNPQYKADLTSIALWPVDIPYEAPCTACLELCEMDLLKGQPTTSKLFIVLAHEYVQSKKLDYKNKSVTTFLSLSVLTITAKNGLGMIHMLEQVCAITSLDWRTLKENTLFNVTTQSWKQIKEFLMEHVENKEQYGYNWARIIDDGFLRRLTQKENMALATIFGAVLEKVQGDGIWRSEWAKSKGNFYINIRRIGYALYDKCVANKESSASGTVETETANTSSLFGSYK